METYSSPTEAIESLNLYGPLIVADFGAGAGFFSIPLAKKISAEGIIYALDIQEIPLEALRKKAREAHLYNIETLKCNLEQPHGSNLGNECADFILVGHILFQASDKEAIINEAFRVLKKNGRIMIVEWDARSLSIIGPDTATRVSCETVKELLQKHALIIEKEFTVGEHYYGIIARKPQE